MLRKVVGVAVAVVLFAGFALADEIRAVIVKVDGGKVTFAPVEGKGKEAKKGPEKTLPVAKNVKVVTAKFNRDTKKVEAGDALEGGLKNEMFSKISDKGVRATVVTDADNKKITEIRVFKRTK